MIARLPFESGAASAFRHSSLCVDQSASENLALTLLNKAANLSRV